MVKRVGFDAKRAFNNQTGLGNYARFVIESMLQQYPDVTFYLFTPKINAAFTSLYKAYGNAQLVMPTQFIHKQFPAMWRSTAITHAANALQLDVYHGLSNELPINIKKFDGKKVVTIHDLIFLRYPQYYKAIDRNIYKRKFSHACNLADTIVATSHQTKADIVEFFGIDEKKITVVYQNCHPQFYQPNSQQQLVDVAEKYNLKPPYILSVGTIEERKNQLTILQAFNQSQVNSNLVFVGKQTPYASLLHAYIKQHHLGHKVKFIEGASFTDFPAIYQLADRAVYASEFEGFGIPIVEAMASNCAVIAANTSSLTEVGGDAISYFKPKAVQELADLLTKPKEVIFNQAKQQNQLQLFQTKPLTNQLFGLYV